MAVANILLILSLIAAMLSSSYLATLRSKLEAKLRETRAELVKETAVEKRLTLFLRLTHGRAWEEEKARSMLLMLKPNEILVVIPKEEEGEEKSVLR